MTRVRNWLTGVVVAAIAIRIAAWLLEPLLPALIVALAVASLLVLVSGHPRGL